MSGLVLSECAETYTDWVSRLRADSTQRRKSARRTSALASSSSPSTTADSPLGVIWPTPDASVMNDREEPETFLARQLLHATKDNPTRAGLTLAIASKMFPTPSASDAHRGGEITDQMTGASLAQFINTPGLWPTATVGDSDRGADQVRRDTGQPNSHLTTAVQNWPTPATRDYKGPNSAEHLEVSTGALHLDQLPNFVAHLWSTPRVVQGGYTRDKGKPGQERLTLEGEAKVWSTPAVADVQGGRKARSGERSTELLLNGQSEQVSSRLDPKISTDGSPTSRPPRALNPVFVEALMGWPEGWTTMGRFWIGPSITGSTVFGCSETVLFLWKVRMRGAAFLLPLPEGRPVQPSLFG